MSTCAHGTQYINKYCIQCDLEQTRRERDLYMDLLSKSQKDTKQTIIDLRNALAIAMEKWQEADYHWALEFTKVPPNWHNWTPKDDLWVECKKVLDSV